MQVLKVNTINFNGKPPVPTKKIQQTITPEFSKKVIMLPQCLQINNSIVILLVYFIC